MTNFLSGDALSEKIIQVCKGSDLRIASAFWGKGAVEHLDIDPASAKIICDISMGGTNPEELRNLGAPNNVNLRAIPGLHAKVYLSSHGGVVCSANASNNGVGFFNGSAKLVEAGIGFENDSQNWLDATNWFDGLLDSENCQIVNSKRFKLAERAWRRRAAADGRCLNGNAFDIDKAIMTAPERLAGWGFVFTNTAINESQRGEVAVANGIDQNGHDFFFNWGDQVDSFPIRFINVHRDGRDINLYLNQTIVIGKPVSGVDDVVITQLLNFLTCFPRGSKGLTERGGLANLRNISMGLEAESGLIFQDVNELRDHIAALNN